ncbi:DUF4419 domain-containing protein [Kibdelosporangium phytohabitans]|uniref:DUF4419 domain-containing protein n=1 Tax=Kibdelosporangium phytohabitans TaxID=860235 RepID=A0A0N9I1Z5_9PSEU|nr:DUF4419 domain-containing protein [Kibdelosporangium phytohabitans]ALG10041.1 hypothetical protein AOZ06_26900 [Kibdelosporangium phytohabitans]MBE1461010.1 hypothetical protein [Kibdelosporangium phytohabitans]
MIVFAVDDVAPVTDPLPARPLREVHADAIAIGGDPARPIIEPDGVHPLLSAVGRAFAEHRPLVLSPDAVWLTIAQGVAQHIRLNAAELRPMLVRHEGRERLPVHHSGVTTPNDPDSWQYFVEAFSKRLAEEITDAEIFECDFSTSTPVERTAGRVVLLDAYSSYFSLWLISICGIPSITLTGTVDDWRRIRSRVDYVEQLGLETWCRSLRPITDQFARAAAGDVDTAFWKRIYNPVDAYGGEVINGWAARFYPYVKENGVISRPNPLLELTISEPKGTAGMRGIRSDAVPATLSTVRVNVREGDNSQVALHAGLVGVAQDPDGALRPIAGWHLMPATPLIDDVIDRLIKEHDTTAPAESKDTATAELIAIDRRIGSAALLDGTWRLRSEGDRSWLELPGGAPPAQVVADLPGDRHLALVLSLRNPITGYWIVCHSDGDQLADDPADVPVYGTSLAMVLDAAMDSGGDIEHLRTGMLTDLLGGH